jgi:hypothetical protein
MEKVLVVFGVVCILVETIETVMVKYKRGQFKKEVL